MCVAWPQSCPILCDSTDCSPLGSSVRGILQARILEGVAVSFPRGSSQLRSDPGIKPRSPALQADSLPTEPPGKACLWRSTYNPEAGRGPPWIHSGGRTAKPDIPATKWVGFRGPRGKERLQLRCLGGPVLLQTHSREQCVPLLGSLGPEGVM